MSGFFRKLERFIVNLIVIALIILISFQILMKNETTYQRIKDLEFAFKDLLGFQQQKTVQVAEIEKNPVGMVTIDLLQDLSLPQVWLIKNGKRIADFSDGVVLVRVEEGDLLSIDARFYSKPLWFEITSLSPSIRTWQVGQQFRIREQEIRLGIVQFYDKL